MRWFPSIWMTCLLSVVACGGLYADDAVQSREEGLFRKAGLQSDDASVLAYLAGRAIAADDVDQIDTLIRQLGNSRFALRQKAKSQLIALGPVALPALKQYLDHSDPEVARSAKECASQIEGDTSETCAFLPLAAVRLLARRKAGGTVEALLRYLPVATHPDVEEEIYYSLDALALREGKVHPALAAALADRVAARRAVAACIVGRIGDAKQKETVRKLLADADANVRLRAAQGQLACKDTAGIPALIALLMESPREIAWQAEELLRWLAGEASPAVVLGDGNAEARRTCKAAWGKWWAETKAIDWGFLDRTPRRPGLVMLRESAFCLYGCDGVLRWRAATPAVPWPWLYLPNGHIIAATEDDHFYKVAEWDATGKQIWQTSERYPFLSYLRKLPDGRTLALGDRILLALDPQGKVLRKQEHRWSSSSEWPAWISDMGRFYSLRDFDPERQAAAGHVREFDPLTNKCLQQVDIALGRWKQKVACCAPPGDEQFLVGLESVEVGRNGLPVGEKEYDPLRERRFELRRVGITGRTLWQTERAGGRPGFLVPLPNGNVLVTSSDAYSSWVVELDADGRGVWELICQPGSEMQVVYPLIRFGFSRPRTEAMEIDRSPHRVRQLANGQEVERKRAASRLAWLKVSTEELRVVSRYLKDADKGVQRHVLFCLSRNANRVDKTAIPGLLALLDYPIQYASEEAREAELVLRQLGQDAFTALVAIYEDEKKPQQLRARAARTLAHWVDDPCAAGVLRRALHDKDSEVRVQTAFSLCQQHEKARPWVPEVLKLLDSKDKEFTKSIIMALACLRPAADSAIPALLDRLSREEVRSEILSSLSWIGYYSPEALIKTKDRVVPAMVTLLGPKQSPQTRMKAAWVLRWMGPAASGALPALRAALQDRRPIYRRDTSTVRENMVGVLDQLGDYAKESIPGWLDLLRDKKERQESRIAALRALVKAGLDAKTAVPLLLSIIEEEQNISRLATVALEALRGLDPTAATRATIAFDSKYGLAGPRSVPR